MRSLLLYSRVPLAEAVAVLWIAVSVLLGMSIVPLILFRISALV